VSLWSSIQSNDLSCLLFLSTEYQKSSDAECGERFPHVECSGGRIVSVKGVEPALNASSHDCQRTVSCGQSFNLDECYKHAALAIYRKAKSICNGTKKCDSMFADPTASDIRTNCIISKKTCVKFQLNYTCAKNTSKSCLESHNAPLGCVKASSHIFKWLLLPSLFYRIVSLSLSPATWLYILYSSLHSI